MFLALPDTQSDTLTSRFIRTGIIITLILPTGMRSISAAPLAPPTSVKTATPALEPKQVPPTQEAIDAIAPEKLSAEGLTPEQYAFKQEVYRRHVARGINSGRTRVYDLAPSELALIPGTDVLMRKDAAEHLGQLLAAANADLARDLASTSTDPDSLLRQARARRVRELGVNNAYRSASRQFGIWNRNFKGYLEATKEQRQAAIGGEYGSAAADLLREYIGIRVAAPGFSNHQGGIAVDLALRLKPDPQAPNEPTNLGASMAQQDPWKNSWFWNWLKARAGEFGFVEYPAEAWHWEYKPDEAAVIKVK